jgi:hypothetical protein
MIFTAYKNFDLNIQIGYLDNQIFWEGMKRLSYGEVIYKDFYWEYGLLYLLYGLPAFILLGQGIKAYLIIRFFLFPITNMALLYFIGKQFLKAKWLLFFVFLSTLFGALNFTGFRHLLPELGLALFIAGVGKKNDIKIYMGSTILGLSFLSSIEYGVVVSIILLMYLTSLIIFQKRKFALKKLILYFLPALAIGLGYLVYLLYHQAFGNMVTYYLESANSFYTLSPCRKIFPRLSDIKNASLSFYLQRAVLYVVPFSLLAELFYLFFKRKKIVYFHEILAFVLFSLLAFSRVIVTPCSVYLNYGMVSFFLPLIILISKEKLSQNVKNIVIALLIYFLAISFPKNLFSFFQNESQNMNKTGRSQYLKIVLEKNLAEEFDEIFKYLDKNISQDSTVFVYPHGPYHLVLNKKSPISTSSTLYYQMSPSLLPKIMADFENNPPDYIIINGINASDYLSNLLPLPYNVISQNEVPLFTGNITQVERFISTHYKIVQKFKRVWVLERREEPVEYISPFIFGKFVNYDLELHNLERTDSPYKFKITGKSPTITYLIKTEDIMNKGLLKIPVKLELESLKMFSKYYFAVFVSQDLDSYRRMQVGQLVSGDWQDYWVLYHGAPQTMTKEYFAIRLELGKDGGFLPFLNHPQYIEIKDPESLILNPDLKVDDYMLEVGGFKEFIGLDEK